MVGEEVSLHNSRLWPKVCHESMESARKGGKREGEGEDVKNTAGMENKKPKKGGNNLSPRSNDPSHRSTGEGPTQWKVEVVGS